MIKKFTVIALLVAPILTHAMTVTYYSIDSIAFEGNAANARICYLNAPQDTLQSVQANMSDNAAALKGMSKDQIAATYHGQFQAIGQGMICQFDAAKLGVSQLPAVVIDGQYVIYGQQDIDMAIREYQEYLERQHV